VRRRGLEGSVQVRNRLEVGREMDGRLGRRVRGADEAKHRDGRVGGRRDVGDSQQGGHAARQGSLGDERRARHRLVGR